MAEHRLTDTDRKWIGARATDARSLVTYLLRLPQSPEHLDAGLLDRAFRAWRHERVGPEIPAQAIVECLGSAFGEYLVDTLKATWLVVEDNLGTDFAIREPRQALLTYPLAVVSKRLNSPPEELSFFGPIADGLRGDLPFKAVGSSDEGA